MPERPRQHQLESESRVAFESRLPSAWVVRHLDQDYGIDAQVEIFDEDGLATALTFLVQIKATDSPDLADPPFLRFSKDKADYYRNLDLPTLVVLYHAPTDRMFVKWIHNWDTYEERKTKKTCSFTFADNSEWNGDKPQRITKELLDLRRIRSPVLVKPFIIEIVTNDLVIHEFEMTHVVSALRSAGRELGSWLRFEGPTVEPGTAPTQLKLSPEKISVWLAGMHGTTIHSPEGYPGDLKNFVDDLLVAIGIGLHWHGHSGPGAQLIANHVNGSTLKGSSTMVVEIATALAVGERIPDALKLLELLFSERDSWEQAFMCYHGITATLFRPGTRGVDKALAAASLERVAEKLRDEEPHHAATICYNIANIYRDTRENRKAVRMYHRALRLWPDYGERQYFNAELAGILFDSRRYRLSAQLYAKAVENTATDDLYCRYADALFFSGEFGKAVEIWEDHANAPEWVLKRDCGKALIHNLGYTSQARRPIEARTEDDFELALQLDGLDPRAWWNFGQSLIGAGKHKEAMVTFLLSAFSSRLDKEAWLNAIACAHNANEAVSMAAILSVGISWFGEEFFVEFLDRVGGDKDDEFRKMAMQAMTAFGDSRDTKSVTLRFHEWGPKYDLVATKEITVSEAGEIQDPDR